ncbi:MAG: long-chain fatty acid--CoA ligase [Betaproteobacteria bacterium]|nr:long-chain fatty acid--CoA ligase [Betaproteobacteria bacterium]
MNLSRIVERWAEHFPAKVALHFHGADWSYAMLWERVEEATRALAASGVAKGERVAFLGTNHPDMLVLLFALARLGAILVPLNWRLTAAEHRVIVGDCAPRLLYYEPEYQAHAAALGTPARVLDGKWREAGGSPALEGCDSDDVLIVYTSGTTGRPKGAVLQQSALLWNGFNSIHAHDLSQADHVLNALPMFHVGGLNNQTLPALLAGATVTLHKRFDPGLWLADVTRRKPTVSILVPATMQAIVQHPDWERTDLSSLKMINSGSMVVPDSLIRAFHARGVPVGQIYGCTETAPIAVVLLKEDAYAMVGSAGKPAPHCEVRIAADERGAEAPADEVGELWVRGPNVMRGYWNDPEATRAAFVDGWFRTGDLARRDANGFFWIAGRSKDMIISGGENIYPAELENVLADCAAIAEAAVIGVEDPKWGEAACACVVRKPGAELDEQAVRALFDDRLARYKHPRRVVFLESLPKNALGKVQKFDLRKLLETRRA